MHRLIEFTERSYEIDTALVPILHMSKLRQREGIKPNVLQLGGASARQSTAFWSRIPWQSGQEERRGAHQSSHCCFVKRRHGNLASSTT